MKVLIPDEQEGYTISMMISAVVLTHNDEARIAKTLESVSWCDEVLVIDDISTDKTCEIARKQNAKVSIHALQDDFAAQRNFGLSKAKNNWVLFVDSDEVVTAQLMHEITHIVQKSRTTKLRHGVSLSSDEDTLVGYLLKRRDYMFGRWLKHGETAKVKLLRLARKNAGKWIRPVHEVWEVKGPTGELVHPLLHYPHQNVAQFLDEINQYSTLNAQYLYSKGNHVSWWQIIAYPKLKFFLSYIWYLGFLDRTAGMVVALMMSFHSFLTRAKLWKLWDKT